MGLDFKSIFDVDNPIYVHSHTKYLEASLIKENFSFIEVLQQIKLNLLTTIKRDINEFRAIENEIVSAEISKYKDAGQDPPFTNRKEYLEYLRNFKKTLDNTPGTAVFSFVNFKKGLFNSKEMVTKAIASYEKVLKEYEKDHKTKLTADQKKSIKVFLKSADRSLTPAQRKELERIIEDINKQLTELSDQIAIYFDEVIAYTRNVYDPHTGASSELDEKKIVTAAQKLQKILTDMGIKFDSEQKSFITDLRKKIQEMGVEKFFATFFEGAKSREFLSAELENYQVGSKLGDVYEKAFFDTLTTMMKENFSKGEIPLFNADDIKLLGNVSTLAKVTPIDISLVEHTRDNKNKIFLGASLKLKAGKKDIKLEKSPIENFWNQFIAFVGPKEAQRYTYMRQNIIALQIHSEDEPIKFDLKELNLFEKEIFEILSITRMLFGFYEMIGDQYKTSGSEANEFYYSAYVYGLDTIFSSADVLEGMLKSVEKGNNKLFSVSGFNENTARPSREKLKTLWKEKKNAGDRFKRTRKQLTYANLLKDDEVVSILKDINATLGEFGFKGSKLEISMTENQMEQAAKLIGG